LQYYVLLLGEKPIDSLQLMMDAAEGSSGDHRKLTDEEITGNAFVFILAG
jgi:cytochrome P450